MTAAESLTAGTASFGELLRRYRTEAGLTQEALAERAGCERVEIRQGEEMGRPSLLEVEMVDGRPRVGGGVIPLIDGEVSLP